MTAQASLLVIYGLLIVGLGLGLGGCLRAIRALHERIAQSMGQPRRLNVGDRLTLPSSVGDMLTERSVREPYIILFGRRECRSCVRAANVLREAHMNSSVSVLGFWQDDVPELAESGIDIGAQAGAMSELNVGVLPFAVLMENGVITARGAVGSESALKAFGLAVRDIRPETSDALA